MPKHPVFAMTFARIYPMYVMKVESKKRTKKELDEVLSWLTGYDAAGLRQVIQEEKTLEAFIDEAPRFHPNAKLITGTVCHIRVEEIADPLMKKLRQMDKLVDELAQGRAMEKILRQPLDPAAAAPAKKSAAKAVVRPKARAAAKGRGHARSK